MNNYSNATLKDLIGSTIEQVRHCLDATEGYYDDFLGEQRREIFLGTVFNVMPSGKYYTCFACNNVTDAQAEDDEAFRDRLEDLLAEHGLYLTNGEGDPCDLLIGEVVSG